MDRSTKATLSTYNTWIHVSRLQKIYHFQSSQLRLATIAFNGESSSYATGPRPNAVKLHAHIHAKVHASMYLRSMQLCRYACMHSRHAFPVASDGEVVERQLSTTNHDSLIIMHRSPFINHQSTEQSTNRQINQSNLCPSPI